MEHIAHASPTAPSSWLHNAIARIEADYQRKRASLARIDAELANRPYVAEAGFPPLLVAEIAAHGTFNMLLSSGGELFAHCSTSLHYLVRQHPFPTAKLSDEDLSVDFSQVTTPQDRVAVIVTQPLTTNEQWTAFAPGELKLFVDGMVQESPAT